MAVLLLVGRRPECCWTVVLQKDKFTIERIGGSMNRDTTYLINHRQTSTPHTNFNLLLVLLVGGPDGKKHRP